MSQPLKHDRYGRPITRYELPLLEPAQVKSSRFIPELDANHRPCSACPRCNGGNFWRFRFSVNWFCIACEPADVGPVLMFCGEVKR